MSATQLAGFTAAPAVQAIVGPLAEPDASGGIRRFRGLLGDAARQLLALLPAFQREERQGFAPTFGELVGLGQRFPQVTFEGYVVEVGRPDERITLDGFTIDGLSADEALALREEFEGADDLDVDKQPNGTYRVHIWWS